MVPVKNYSNVLFVMEENQCDVTKWMNTLQAVKLIKLVAQLSIALIFHTTSMYMYMFDCVTCQSKMKLQWSQSCDIPTMICSKHCKIFSLLSNYS